MSQPMEKRQKVEHLHDVRCADGTIQMSTHDIERLVSDVGGNLQVVHLMKRSALESIISEYNKNPTVTITCVDGEVISMLLTEKNKLVDSVGGSASVLSGMKKSIVEVLLKAVRGNTGNENGNDAAAEVQGNVANKVASPSRKTDMPMRNQSPGRSFSRDASPSSGRQTALNFNQGRQSSLNPTLSGSAAKVPLNQQSPQKHASQQHGQPAVSMPSGLPPLLQQPFQLTQQRLQLGLPPQPMLSQNSADPSFEASGGTYEQRHKAWAKGKGVFHCDLCDVDCQTQEVLDSHKKGRKHKKKAKKARREARWAAAAGDPQSEEQAKEAEAKRIELEKSLPPQKRYERGLVRCSKKEDCKLALNLFESSEKEGLTTTIDAFNQILRLICEFGDEEDQKRGAKVVAAARSLCNNAGSAEGSSADGKKKEMSTKEIVCITLILRLSAVSGDLEMAKAQLQILRESGHKLSCRMYSPLLLHHPVETLADLEDLFALYEDGKGNSVEYREEDFCAILSACSQFVSTKKPDEAARDAAAQFFEKAMDDMHEVFHLVGPEVERVLLEWYGSSAKVSEIDAATGACSNCGRRMQSIDLTPDERKTMLEKIHSDLVIPNTGENGKVAFGNFTRYLERKGPADVIIDGANVGYFNMSASGDINFSQIDRVARYFESQMHRFGGRVIIVLHSRHLHISKLREDRSGEKMMLSNRWRQAGLLYKTPPKMNDDWFWLYGSIPFRSSNVPDAFALVRKAAAKQRPIHEDASMACTIEKQGLIIHSSLRAYHW
eukprot:g763.t1